MENAVNIMALVQSNSIVKKKFDVPSKALGNDIANFRKELNQAKKDITKDYRIDSKDVEARTQSTTEKKVEKFAKVMSGNNFKSEVKDEVKEVVKEVVKEKPTVEALERTDAVEIKSNVAEDEAKQLGQIEEDVAIEELIQPTLDVLQQLIQMMEGQKVEGLSNQQLTELKTELQVVIQKLEQALEVPTTSQAVESNKLLSSLKNDLSELVKQLEIVPEVELDAKQTVQLIKQLSDKLNQAKDLNHQILQKTEKPDNSPKVLHQQLAQTVKVESKESTTDNTVKVAEVADENQQIQKSNNEKTSDKKNSEESDENTYKTNEKNDVEQAATGDKLNKADINEILAPQVEKDNFKLNIKQVNANLQKENLVKFNKSDIINQVIKKADLFVQGSHQEMVMKLEPESLGKLNLKIIVENGLVTAKFTAESQQVKAVLESSFNQLKDALQEKGITVQSFSVSVGQQGAEFNSGQGFEKWKQTFKSNNKTSGEYMGLDEENSSSINPYSYHDGKVDYRA